MAMRHGGAASLASGHATVKARHLGVGGALVDEMICVGSRSICPSDDASRAAFTALRRCSAACVDFFFA